MKNTNFIQHPWEILKEELEFRGITGKDFAKVIWKSSSELSELLNWKRNMTALWAILISASLEISAEFWLWLQKDYDLSYELKKLRKPNLQLVKEKAQKIWILETI